MDAGSEMLGLLRSRRDGFCLPQPFYNSPDFFRLDLELIWSRDWLFAGHDCEIANPGTFFTFQIGDYPVVVVREGQLEARMGEQPGVLSLLR
jgi:Rieske 2Fe-2S family protein